MAINQLGSASCGNRSEHPASLRSPFGELRLGRLVSANRMRTDRPAEAVSTKSDHSADFHTLGACMIEASAYLLESILDFPRESSWPCPCFSHEHAWHRGIADDSGMESLPMTTPRLSRELNGGPQRHGRASGFRGRPGDGFQSFLATILMRYVSLPALDAGRSRSRSSLPSPWSANSTSKPAASKRSVISSVVRIV